MKTITHHAFNNETIYVTIQLNSKQIASLREYMHTKPQDTEIWFPHGVSLVKRGFGWYRLLANNGIRGVEKIQFAMKIIMRWRKEETEKVEEQIKQLMPAVLSQTRTVAFSAAHSEGEYLYAGNRTVVPKDVTTEIQPKPDVKPADPLKLAYLASVFNSKHSTRHSRG